MSHNYDVLNVLMKNEGNDSNYDILYIMLKMQEYLRKNYLLNGKWHLVVNSYVTVSISLVHDI